MRSTKMFAVSGASICRWFGLSVALLLMPIPLACGSIYAPGKDPYHARKFYLQALGREKALRGGPQKAIQAQKSAAPRKRALLDLLEAAYTKNPTAEYYTGLYYLKVRNYRYAITWLTDAAKGGCVRADILLGTEIYNDGVGTRANAKRAQTWLWRAQLTGKGGNPLVGRVISLLAEHFYRGDGLPPKGGLSSCPLLMDQDFRDFKGVASSGQRRSYRLWAMWLMHLMPTTKHTTFPGSKRKYVVHGRGQWRKYNSITRLLQGGARGRLIALAEERAGPPLSPLTIGLPSAIVGSAKLLPEPFLLRLVERWRMPRMVNFMFMHETMFILSARPRLQVTGRRIVFREMERILAFIERHKGRRAGLAALALLELRVSLMRPGSGKSRVTPRQLSSEVHRIDALSRHAPRALAAEERRLAQVYRSIALGAHRFPRYLGGL